MPLAAKQRAVIESLAPRDTHGISTQRDLLESLGEHMLETWRRLAWNNLFFFCKYVLGYKDIEVQPHWELVSFLTEHWGEDQIILLPRGTFKSTILTIGRTLWRLWDDPELAARYPKMAKFHDANKRVLITGAEYENSKRFVAGIRDHIERNGTFKAICGDWDPHGARTWTTESLCLATRTALGQPQDSVTAASMLVTKVSQHYDEAVVDDLVTDKVVATRSGVERAMEYLNLLLPILDPQHEGSIDPGPRYIVGTRWRYNDPYAQLFAHDRLLVKSGKPPRFRRLVRKAHNPEWTWVYFPTRFSPEYLEKLRKESGLTPYQYSCQYLNDPIAEGDQPFKLSRARWYHEEDLPKSLVTFTVIDPAIGQTDRSDWTAIVTVSVDADSRWYVRDCSRGRWLPDAIIEHIWSVCDRYRPSVLAVESVAYQRALYLALRASQAHRGRALPITELRPDTQKSKEMRIFGLEPYWSSGVLHFLADPAISLNQQQELLMTTALNGQDQLIDEAVHFPLAETVDCLDALAYVPSIAFPSRAARAEKPRRSTFEEARRMALATHRGFF
jgi:hypothetical protein